MIDQVPGFFVLTAFFFALFFAITLLFDRQKKKGALLTLLKKIPWDTVVKIFFVWTIIIFLRKLTYYFHLNGIIQTKDTLFWADEKVKIMILCSLGIIISSIGFIKAIPSVIKTHDAKRGNFAWILILFVFTMVSLPSEITFEQFLISFTITPLLLLKMLCSGKYLGLLTALLTALYIVNKHKKLKTGNTKINAKFFIVPGLIIIAVLLFSYQKFTGDWQEKFTGRIQAAKSTRALEDLIDAANSIKNGMYKSIALRETAVAIAKTGDIQWAVDTAETMGIMYKKNRSYAFKEIAAAASKTGDMKNAENILQQSVTEAGALNDTGKLEASREIILTLLETGKALWSPGIFQRLFDIVEMIPGGNEKIAFLEEIISAASEASNKNAVEEIIQHSFYTVDTLKYNRNTLSRFKKIVGVVSNRKDIKWPEEFYLQIIDAALAVEDREEKSGLLREIAVSVAGKGDIKWASSIANSIPADGIRSLALIEIREIRSR